MRIYVTGSICVEAEHRLIREAELPRRQGRLAFAMLVLERERPVSTDELVELLWPGRPPSAHLVAVSALVSKLRRLLEEAGAGPKAIINAFGCYQLKLPPRAWVDAEAAMDSLHQAEAALRAGREMEAYGPAVVAAAILRRPFMHGEYGDWVDARRERFRAALARTLECLVRLHDWNREPTLAIAAAEELVALEPFRESGYRDLVALQLRAGNPAEARLTYERCRELFARELGTMPSLEWPDIGPDGVQWGNSSEEQRGKGNRA
jgi:DNA-binding SARP family transcriptional activator